MTDGSKTKKRIAWWKVLLIWVGVMMAAGAALCVVLYKFLDVYEQTRPEAVMEELLADNSTEELITLAKDNVTFTLTRYESPEELYAEYVEGVDTTKALTYRLDTSATTGTGKEGNATASADTGKENTGADGANPTSINLTAGKNDLQKYIVRSGAYNICNVTLEQYGEPVGFGRKKWKIASVEAADVTKVLQGVNVAVDVIPGEEGIFALNNLAVGEDYISSEEVAIDDESDSAVERSMANPPVFNRITVGPLYTDVCVTDADGNVIACKKEENGTLYFRASEPQYKCVVEAPDDIEVCVNGVPLTNDYAAVVNDKLFEGLEEYVGDAGYRTVRYDVEPLYLEPEVTAGTGSGVSVVPVKEGEWAVLHDDGESEDGERYAVAKDYFTAYMNYSSYSYNGGSFSVLLSKILPGTELYNYVANSRAAMIWASATKTEYKNLSFENFHSVGDNCFVCTISYDADMTASSWYERYSYELKNSYEVVFVKKNDRWYAAKMSVLSGQE